MNDDDPTLEAMVEAEVTRALRAYEDSFPPELIEEMRHMLRIFIRTHPATVPLLEQLRPRVAPSESAKEDVRPFNGARARAKRAKGE